MHLSFTRVGNVYMMGFMWCCCCTNSPESWLTQEYLLSMRMWWTLGWVYGLKPDQLMGVINVHTEAASYYKLSFLCFLPACSLIFKLMHLSTRLRAKHDELWCFPQVFIGQEVLRRTSCLFLFSPLNLSDRMIFKSHRGQVCFRSGWGGENLYFYGDIHLSTQHLFKLFLYISN